MRTRGNDPIILARLFCARCKDAVVQSVRITAGNYRSSLTLGLEFPPLVIAPNRGGANDALDQLQAPSQWRVIIFIERVEVPAFRTTASVSGRQNPGHNR